MATYSVYLTEAETFALVDYIRQKNLTKFSTNEILRRIIRNYLKSEGFLSGKE